MRKLLLLPLLPGLLLLMAVVLVLALLLLKFLWAWTIPDLFPGAVAQGLVAGTISWLTAFKMAIFVAVLGGVAGVRSGEAKKGGK